MKAAIYKGVKNIEIKELPIPECGDKDILVKNLYASVCGSDIQAYFHDGDSVRIFKDFEFGHEMVSEVVTVGKNVKDISVGDIVYPYPREAKNDNTRSATVGGFSEYVLIPNCELNRSVYKVSDKIPTKVAALTEPLTVGISAARVARPQKGQTAVVFGAGIIGAAAAMALKFWGADKVMVVDMSEYRLNIMEQLGFITCNGSKENFVEKAKTVFGELSGYPSDGADVDIYIDAIGAAPIIEQWQKVAKFNSKLVIVGVHHAPVSVDFTKVTFRRIQVLGSGGYFPEDVHTAFEIMESGKFNLELMMTHEFGIEDIARAIETASDSQNAFKVIIKY